MSRLLPITTTTDLTKAAIRCALLPIGSFEQHGKYLPLITDTAIASIITREIAAAYPALHLPPITISCSHEHSGWPGTVSVSARTLYSIIADVSDSLSRSHNPPLILVNGHGGNYVLGNIVQEANAHNTPMALFPTSQDWATARADARLTSTSHEDMHAGEIETSILLHAEPDLVRDGYETADWIADERPHLLTKGMSAYSRSGVIGRPSLASADKGKAVIDSLVKSFSLTLEAVTSTS